MFRKSPVPFSYRKGPQNARTARDISPVGSPPRFLLPSAAPSLHTAAGTRELAQPVTARAAAARHSSGDGPTSEASASRKPPRCPGENSRPANRAESRPSGLSDTSSAHREPTGTRRMPPLTVIGHWAPEWWPADTTAYGTPARHGYWCRWTGWRARRSWEDTGVLRQNSAR